jgi:hypothetical protein
MAARGDAFAQKALAHFDSYEYRVEEALTNAAAELHPGWRHNGDGTIVKLDDGAPEPPALVEWLYKTYPSGRERSNGARRRDDRPPRERAGDDCRRRPPPAGRGGHAVIFRRRRHDGRPSLRPSH